MPSIETPWGPADDVTTIADGVAWVTTPSHGGIKLSPERQAALAVKVPGFHPFAGREGWYEEDCDWAVVALMWPELFSEDERTKARRTALYFRSAASMDKAYQAGWDSVAQAFGL